MLRKIRHRTRSEIIKLELVCNCFVVIFNDLGLQLGRG
jgi:hypothetical protein